MVEQTWNEFAKLREAFESQINRHDIHIVDRVDEVCGPDDAETCWHATYGYKLRLPQRRKKPRYLALHVEMMRNTPEAAEWPWSKQALLVIAYSNSYNSGWEQEQIQVSHNGRIGAWDDVKPTSKDARLLVWSEDAPEEEEEEKESWAEKEWVFAVPLCAIDSPTALKTEVVMPLIKLLIQNEAAIALEGTKAVSWFDSANSDS